MKCCLEWLWVFCEVFEKMNERLLRGFVKFGTGLGESHFGQVNFDDNENWCGSATHLG